MPPCVVLPLVYQLGHAASQIRCMAIKQFSFVTLTHQLLNSGGGPEGRSVGMPPCANADKNAAILKAREANN